MKPVKRPVRMLQYGEGNFLRGFVDYMVDVANEKTAFNSNVQIIKPIPHGSIAPFRTQKGVYTVLLRGIQDGAEYVEKRVITSVAGVVSADDEYETYAAFAKNPDLRFIVSNTTEAGIVYDQSDVFALTPPQSFPGKLTKFLFERGEHFNYAHDKGFIILPTELIEKNGTKLKECCTKLAEQWNLPDAFKVWLVQANIFCNTLVDRIVTGYPVNEIEALEREWGYSDELLVTGEPFALWVIESDYPQKIAAEFPMGEAGLPVIFTNDMQPYRERKVRLLNGGHTASVLAAYLSGLDTVKDMMNDKTLRGFLVKAMYTELAPYVPLPQSEVKAFADSVIERFENPFIRHNLLSISLNSVSKFKARVLPTILETFEATGKLPHALCFSLSALIAFYCGAEPETQRGDKLIGRRGSDTYDIMDNKQVLAFFAKNHGLPGEKLVTGFLSRVDFWDRDLTAVTGLTEQVTTGLRDIREKGMRAAVEGVLA